MVYRLSQRGSTSLAPRGARAAIVGAALAVALVGQPNEPASAAHPCTSPIEPQLRIIGTPRAGQFTVVHSRAPSFDRLDWGDGTAVRARLTRRDGTLRHRYRRPDNYTIVATQLVSECCDVGHTNCSPAGTARDRLRIRVRAAG